MRVSKKVFVTNLEHTEPINDVAVNVINSFFINCAATKGGGLFSELTTTHVIQYCIFSRCNATDSAEGRGGGFLINSGLVLVKFCCADRCQSAFGSDLMCYSSSHPSLEYIQSFRSLNVHHSMWTRVTSDSSFKNMNISHSEVSYQGGYGNGVNFCINEVPKGISFVNLVSNEGSTGVLQFENGDKLTLHVTNINIIDNKNQSSFIYFRNCDTCNIIIHHSIFMNNEGSIIVGENTISGSKIQFQSSSFSISHPDIIENVEFSDDCQFSQTLSWNVETNEKCLFNFYFTVQAYAHFEFHVQMFFFFILFS